MTEKLRKKGITALKIVISVVLIYFIFTKIELKDVLQTLKKSDPLYFSLAVLFFVLSKVISAIRTNLYFHQIGAPLTQWSNLKLSLLGMFYNLFLPGGIGGDAYKGYVVQKEYQPGTKKSGVEHTLRSVERYAPAFCVCLLAGHTIQERFFSKVLRPIYSCHSPEHCGVLVRE